MDNSSEKVYIKTFPSAGQKVSLSWNGNQVANNSMVSNQQLYTSSYWSYTTYTPLRCELAGYGNASARQWYGPTGAALPSRDMSVSGGYGQVMVQGTGVDLYSGGVSYTTQGVHRCDIVDANGTLYRLYVAIYNDPSQTYATASCEFPCTQKGTRACTCNCMHITYEGTRWSDKSGPQTYLPAIHVTCRRTKQFRRYPVPANDSSTGRTGSIPAFLHHHLFSRHDRPVDVQRQHGERYYLSGCDGSAIVHLSERPGGDRKDGGCIHVHSYYYLRTSVWKLHGTTFSHRISNHTRYIRRRVL